MTTDTTSLNKAIAFAIKATEEDLKKNYQHALVCYNSSVKYFEEAIENETLSDKDKERIRAKCAQYNERSQKIALTLLAGTTLQKAVELVTKATEEDINRKYEDALRLYELSLGLFEKAIESQVQSDKVKDCIRAKCLLYQDRAEKIKKFLIEKEIRLQIVEAVEEDSNKSSRLNSFYRQLKFQIKYKVLKLQIAFKPIVISAKKAFNKLKKF